MGETTGISWTDSTFNPWLGCLNVSPACDHCLGPDTPVLYADMMWRPIGQARVGDELIGFDEHAVPGHPRKLRSSIVERIWFSRKPRTRLITEHQDIATTAIHRWLRKASHHWVTTRWLKAGRDLRYIPPTSPQIITDGYRIGYLAGMTLGDGTFRYVPGQRSDKLGFPQAYWRVALMDEDALGRLVAYLAHFGVESHIKPFTGGTNAPMSKVEIRSLGNLAIIHRVLEAPDETIEYMRGWIAGVFDAEGEASFDNLRVSQADPEPLFRFRDYAARFGFRFAYEPYDNRTDTLRLADKLHERLRFFSCFQPAIQRKQRAVLGRRCDTLGSKILAIEDAGEGDVVDIQTSTRTFWAAGMATHNCYAETLVTGRMGLPVWGKDAPRKRTSAAYWKQPAKWNKEAEKVGVRRRVFCGSLCDVMEDRKDLQPIREDLYAMIESTPWLDWLLLTKRPQNFRRFLPAVWLERGSEIPPNVWGLTTVETPEYFWRIDALKAVPFPIRGLSIEPLLADMPTLGEHLDGIDWVLVGGESGGQARPMHPDWARRIRDECLSRGIAFHFKQNGEFIEFRQSGLIQYPPKCRTVEVQQTAQPDQCPTITLCRIGKRAAGHLLDGKEWLEFPAADRREYAR